MPTIYVITCCSATYGTVLLCLILYFFYLTDKTSAYVDEENVPPISTEDVAKQLIGQMKGIQGHCNSCYMDSALFRLELIDPWLKMKELYTLVIT